jgi:2,4-dienoyl-CoA reductase-like NADH-dependent reductase (Old Yellow Enzyme family)
MLQSPLTLPCGATLPNRLVKAAMTERLSRRNALPNEAVYHLYEQWAATGAGLLITGNVVLNRKHMESAGNVILKDESCLPEFSRWAAVSKQHGGHIWMQISHSGRQTHRFLNLHPKAPSEVQLNKLGLFGTPRVMSEADIQEVIQGFIRTASLAKKAGFTGVQIHSAHGYLLSQFLSPITNHRQDQWGGSLENRMRLLRTIVQRVRAAVGTDYPISVKINSADFQRGGFEEADSLEVIRMLEQEQIDLLEISGGTYEKLAFFEGEEIRATTRHREAYFLGFAKKVREVSKLPLMVTGGFRTYQFCNKALQNEELDLIGMARPFITNLDDIPGFLKGEIQELSNDSIQTGFKILDSVAEGGYYALQLIRLARKKGLKPNVSGLGSVFFFVKHEFVKALGKRLG